MESLEVKFPRTVNHSLLSQIFKGNREKCLFLCALPVLPALPVTSIVHYFTKHITMK
jgi:hypothetical protein